MNLSELQSIIKKEKRRLGQGHGSGRSKTAGRGTKGQKSRGKIPFTRYSGGSMAFVKSLPFLRGKGRNLSFQEIVLPLNIEKLNTLPKGSVVDAKTLVAHNIISAKTAKQRSIKILGKGKLDVALTVKLPVSASAKVTIEKAGGKIEI